jgi:hypothetical protein
MLPLLSLQSSCSPRSTGSCLTLPLPPTFCFGDKKRKRIDSSDLGGWGAVFSLCVLWWVKDYYIGYIEKSAQQKRKYINTVGMHIDYRSCHDHMSKLLGVALCLLSVCGLLEAYPNHMHIVVEESQSTTEAESTII